ncbi:MAG: 1-acyl-sn-glycerol-3-phosphate acyltransferase [Bacteroidales bacterium]|nr:1-acyl-sn-glycerol-3-phosphate acyltransferase [Bacteroidales bacterium]
MNVSDFLYRLFRPVVDFATQCHYASITIKGAERLPKEGGYILAPCHQNAMMEPLLILVMISRPVYFICRGDIFAHPIANRFLTFLKMFPIFRRRDGLKCLERNQHTFDQSQQVLLDGHPLCMMSEGRHNNRHQLLPLVKGLFRIAGNTQAAMGNKPLYIVPLGIYLDDYERPYSHAILNVGNPIDVRQFMTEFLADEPKALNAMRDALTMELRQVMHHIDSQRYYKPFEELCDLMNPQERQKQQLNDTPFNRFLVRQQIAQRLDNLEQTNTPENTRQLNNLINYADEKEAWCHKHHKRLKSIAEPLSLPNLILRISILIAIAIAAVALPLARTIIGFCLMAYPLLLLPTHLLVRRWIDDSQFRSSFNFGIRLLLSALYIPCISIIIGIMHGWIWGLVTFATAIIMARLSAPLTDWFRRIFC